ncbi:unnamed protein product [Miscanthus lutarioriparius]|uniref:Uncharacterized protein n=1 Tax=Miscanthus lutarioriparius TaxID=422564 RepID=A0A811S7K6_9POAL|nr:unnamed protein product [Miscanthus lutarioriparius]
MEMQTAKAVLQHTWITPQHTDHSHTCPVLDWAELVIADAAVALADVDFADADRSLGNIPVPFELGLALSLQLVRFACGGFALSWGTNHLLVDGHGLTAQQAAWAELLRTGGASWEPHHGRASLFRPRSPPRRPHSPVTGRRVHAALSAHVWKLLAAAIGGSDTHCRLAWLVDGRPRLGPARYDRDTLRRYVGNVVTYASREAAVDAISSSPLADVAAMARAAIAEVFRPERFDELVDWMEVRKGVFRDGGKWTEAVGAGTGSPAQVLSAFVAFRVDGDFGFGRPRLVMPWVRPGQLGSAAMMVARSPEEDGSWVVYARMWPRLSDAVEADPEAVLKPATAARLGFSVTHTHFIEPAITVKHASRL